VGEHPAVVLTPPIQIERGDNLRVAVCSTGCYPLRPGWFEMPSRPGPSGDPMTGLMEACAVKGTWIETVPQQSVRMRHPTNRCPARIFRQLQAWLAEKHREAT
jgi:mRNA-degrading endonuclease toxin of MazEF toxin-antitoxin module